MNTFNVLRMYEVIIQHFRVKRNNKSLLSFSKT